MKSNILCITVLFAIIADGILAASPYDINTPEGLLVGEPLDGFGYSRRNPKEGEIWQLTSDGSMRVFQVLDKDGGVLVERYSLFPVPFAKNIFVKTSRVYADGDMLKSGYYKSTGTFSYIGIDNARRTVYSFFELLPDQQQAINRYIAEKEAEKEELIKQRERLRQEQEELARREAQEKRKRDEENRKRDEQTRLANVAKERLSSINIEAFQKNLIVSNLIRKQMADSKAAAILADLAEAQHKGEWLRMLSMAQDLLQKKQGNVAPLIKYPPIEVLNQLVACIENLTLTSDMFPMGDIVLIRVMRQGEKGLLEEMSEDYHSRVTVCSGQAEMSFNFAWRSESLCMALDIKSDGECKWEKSELHSGRSGGGGNNKMLYNVEVAKYQYLICPKGGLISPVRQDVVAFFASQENRQIGEGSESESALKAQMVIAGRKLAKNASEHIERIVEMVNKSY